MITDKNLGYLCFILVIIGIAGIVIILQFTGPRNMGTGLIYENNVGENVLVSGVIKSYSESQGHVFMDIDDGTGEIKVVIFENTAKNQAHVYGLGVGGKVIVEGKVQIYKNELEIIADSVNVV